MENWIPLELKEHYAQRLSDNFKDVYKLRLEKLRIRADRRDALLKILLSIKEAHDEGHPYVTMSDIVEKSGIEHSNTVWRLVNRLVREGLVDKVPLDRPKHARKKQTGRCPETGFALNRDFALSAAFKALYIRSTDW